MMKVVQEKLEQEQKYSEDIIQVQVLGSKKKKTSLKQTLRKTPAHQP